MLSGKRQSNRLGSLSSFSGTIKDMDQNNMHHLLTIPRELRDEIFTLVVLGRRLTPETALEIETQSRETLKDISLRSWGPHAICYLTSAAEYTPIASGALPLLLVNKQMHEETKENLERISRHCSDYELDVKLVREEYLAPTWIKVPAFVEHVRCLRAVFQSVGALIPTEERKHQCHWDGADIWTTGCGGPPGYVWTFYGLLERFLRVGPRG